MPWRISFLRCTNQKSSWINKTEILVLPRPVECVCYVSGLSKKKKNSTFWYFASCCGKHSRNGLNWSWWCYKDSPCSLLCGCVIWLIFWNCWCSHVCCSLLAGRLISTTCAALDHHLSIDDGRGRDGNRCNIVRGRITSNINMYGYAVAFFLQSSCYTVNAVVGERDDVLLECVSFNVVHMQSTLYYGPLYKFFENKPIHFVDCIHFDYLLLECSYGFWCLKLSDFITLSRQHAA